MSIQPLPSDVIARIKSSIAITSLNGVVCELAKNSLDASSSKIDISLDYAKGSCTVEDDGLGILPAEFRDAGGLGKLYREWTTFACFLTKLTSDRYIQAELRESRPWQTRYFPRVSIITRSALDHVSPPLASFPQHHQLSQV